MHLIEHPFSAYPCEELQEGGDDLEHAATNHQSSQNNADNASCKFLRFHGKHSPPLFTVIFNIYHYTIDDVKKKEKIKKFSFCSQKSDQTSNLICREAKSLPAILTPTAGTLILRYPLAESSSGASMACVTV